MRVAFSCFKMSEKPIVPTADAVVTPFLEKLYEKRPNSFQHLNLRSGVYWHPVLGFRAQAAKLLERLAHLAAARRAKTATGQELLEYVASEYTAVPYTGKTFAVGKVTLGRSAPSPLPGGTIPKGFKITRSLTTSLGVVYATAEYETLADAYIPINSTANIEVPIRASREGAHANTPILANGSFTSGLSFQSPIQNVGIIDFEAAGGSDGVDDDYVRTFARAYAQGQDGPTTAEARYAALAGTGVRHLIGYDDVTLGARKILIADSSWASSDRWAALVQQSMYDNDLVGYGCKIVAAKVRNKVVAVEATVALRDTNYLIETTEVQLAIQKAVREYFDNRTDWHVWNTNALKGVIARSHAKVFNCPSVTVKDVNDGAVVTEILTPNYSTEQFHYYVADNAMKLTFVGPS